MIFRVWSGPILAGVVAIVASGCSTARLSELEGPRYNGGASQRASQPVSSRHARAAAPVYSVERSVEPPVRVAEPPGRWPSTRYGGERDYQLGQGNGAVPRGQGIETVRRAPSQVTVAQSSRQEPHYRRRGVARWMGQSWIGRRTTIQEPFDPDRLTGAHATLPLPSYLYVTNRANGRTVLIRLNDRPATSGRRDDTVVLVSRRVADLLDFSRKGAGDVELQYAGPAGLVSSGRHEEVFLRSQPWYARAVGREMGVGPVARRSSPYGQAAGGFPRETRSGLTR